MSTNRDFNRIAAAWLAEGPSELADRVLDDALAEVHLAHQRRGPVSPWRYAPMNGFSRAAAAVLVAALALGGAVYLLGRSNPSASATGASVSGPSAVPASRLAPVTSTVYGYTIGQPPGWDFRAARRTLGDGEQPWGKAPPVKAWLYLPTVDFLFVKEDRYLSLSGPPGAVAVAPVKVPSSETTEAASSPAIDMCGSPTETESMMVDGLTGVLHVYSNCFDVFTQWATVIQADRAFHFVWIDTVGGEGYGRAQFAEILASFRFAVDS